MGILARRTNVNPMFGSTADMLEGFATSQPMRLLSLLPTIHPSVGFALWSALRLMFPEDGVTQRCFTPDGRAAIPSAKMKPNPAATYEVDKLVDGLPQELGGLNGLLTTGAIQSLFSGLSCIEAVLGPPGAGVAEVWPVDSLSITFVRPSRSSPLEAWQKQVFPQWGRDASSGQLTLPGMPAGPPTGGPPQRGWLQASLMGLTHVQMPPESFFWDAVDSDVDDPYGMAPYATCLSEVLADLALMQDLRDAVHNVAWPRLHVGINLTELHKVAVEVHHITDPKAAAKWVMDRMKEARDLVVALDPDENVISDSNGDIKLLQPGGFQGLDNVLTFLRQRIVQSLKTLPTLMGIMDSSNVNVQSVEYGIYTSGLESIRHTVCRPLFKAFNLHLRSKGINAVCVPQYTLIRHNDELVEANALNVRIQNAINAEKMNYLSHEDACIYAFNKEPYGEPRPGVLDAPIDKQSFGEQSSQSGPHNGGAGVGANKQGQSAESRNVQGGKGGSN